MFSQTDNLRQKIALGLIIFIVYAALACLTTWPLVSHISTHLPGGSNDTYLHYWNGWWVQQAFTSVQSPFYTPYIFYPNGASLVTHNIAWFNVLPWLLLEPLIGGILAYNLVFFINLFLCGCALFGLTYRLTDNLYAAFVAGIIYQAWPYRLSQLDHPNLIATYWIPIFFFFLIYTIRHARWRDGLLTGVTFALIGYARWQLLIPATIMGLIYFLCSVPSWWRTHRGALGPSVGALGPSVVLSRLIFAACIALIALLPAMRLLNQEINQENSADLLHHYGEEEERFMQTDVLGYLTPGQSHPVFGAQTEEWYAGYYSDRDVGLRYTVYIGFVAFFLALLGIYSKRWESVPWVLMAIILILLALGPLLRVNGEFYEEVPTLYGALSSPYLGSVSDIIRLMRVPDRFNMFLALPISVLAAYGVTGLLARPWSARSSLSRASQPALLCTLLALLILFEYLEIPHSLYDVSFSLPFEEQLANFERTEGAKAASESHDAAGASDLSAVVNLPIEETRAKLYMFYQITHQRPILQGHTSRMPNEIYNQIDSHPLLRSLREKSEISPQLTDVSRQLTQLADSGVGYLMIHKWFDLNNKRPHWQRYLLIEPYYEDERVLVYSTSRQEAARAAGASEGGDFTLIEEITAGLGPIKTLVSTDCLSPDRVLEVDVGWGSTQQLEQDFDVVISLVDAVGGVQQSERFPLSPEWPTSQWAAHSVAWGYYMLPLSPSVPVGEYTITLTLLKSESGEIAGQPMLIEPVTVQAASASKPEICNPATKPEAKDVNAVYGNQFRLLEYEIQHEPQKLNMTLYWRAEHRMGTSYTMFVHVFDPATGYPVAQYDSKPQNGTYPTSYWWPAEPIVDHYSISLDGVPPGRYGIAIGSYDPSTVQNLPVMTSQGELIEDGRLILEEMIQVE
ncbi:MAG: hypothetical protein ACPGWR_02105 [Ardenticatenaceae bacterium]